MNRLFFPLLIALAMAIATTTLHSQSPADIIGWGFDEFHIGEETGYHPHSLPPLTFPLCVGDAHLTLSANRVRYFVFGSKHSFIITTQIAGGQP